MKNKSNGINENFDVKYFKELLNKLDVLAKTKIGKKQLNKIEAFREIISDVLNKGSKSPYFHWTSPSEIEAEGQSLTQIRTVTINQEHHDKLHASILKIGGVKKPVITAEGPAPSAAVSFLLDGTHRVRASCNLIKEGLVDESFCVPEIRIPANVYASIYQCLPTLQGILNDHEPALGSNTNDVIKIMNQQANLWWNFSGDSSEMTDEQYDELVSWAQQVFTNCGVSRKTIKSNATRVRRSIKEQHGHVVCKNTKEWVALFAKCMGVELDPKKDFTKQNVYALGLCATRINLGSVVGSTIAQNFARQMCALLRGDYDHLVEVVASMNNGGSAQTVVQNRIAYFENMYQNWLLVQKPELKQFMDNVFVSKVVIMPQLTYSQKCLQVGDKFFETKRETVRDATGNTRDGKSSMKVVSREELLSCFRSGHAYLPEWVVSVGRELTPEEVTALRGTSRGKRKTVLRKRAVKKNG